MKNKKNKKKYNLGGPTMTAPGNQGKTAVGQIGQALQGIGGITSIIPGIGLPLSAGLGLLGGIMSRSSAPTMTTPANVNSNPYGFALGGKLKPLSISSSKVKANNPSLTDSVDIGNAMVDDNEVITDDKVFSATLKNPKTGNTFAEDEEMTQSQLGKFEKLRVNINDTEYQDKKILDKRSEDLFNFQEKLATGLGLRMADGSPIQSTKGKFMWGGKKSKMATGGFLTKKGYYTGGDFSPDPPSTEDQDLVATLLANLKGAQVNAAPTDVGIQFGESGTGAETEYFKNPKNLSFIPEIGINNASMLNPYQAGAVDENPPQPNLGISPLSGEESLADPLQSIKPLQPNLISIPGLNKNFDRVPSPFDNPDEEDLGSGEKSMSSPGNLNLNNLFKNNQLSNDTKDLLKNFRGENPFGNRATNIGAGVSALSLLVNKPFYVNYGNIGDPELSQQNQALARMRAGEESAVQDAVLSGATARKNVSNRSIQSRNANLRNIATGTSKSIANIRGQFAARDATLRTQVGARRTAIQQANQRRNMMQDEINTKEYDTLQKENMKALMNFRNLALEKQMAYNHFRRNNTLEKLLKTKDFQWTGDNIEFITSQLNN